MENQVVQCKARYFWWHLMSFLSLFQQYIDLGSLVIVALKCIS